MNYIDFQRALLAIDLTQADLVRVLRKRRGPLTISERGTMSRWATGKRAVPPAIAVLLDVLRVIPAKKRRAWLDQFLG